MFEPTDAPIDPATWKPNATLTGLAIRRCDWVHSNVFKTIQSPEEWLATVIVSCYYQGLADGVRHMARKARGK